MLKHNLLLINRKLLQKFCSVNVRFLAQEINTKNDNNYNWDEHVLRMYMFANNFFKEVQIYSIIIYLLLCILVWQNFAPDHRLVLVQRSILLKCLSFGIPKIINFPFGTDGKLMVLGVPIFKNIIVRVLCV